MLRAEEAAEVPLEDVLDVLLSGMRENTWDPLTRWPKCCGLSAQLLVYMLLGEFGGAHAAALVAHPRAFPEGCSLPDARVAGVFDYNHRRASFSDTFEMIFSLGTDDCALYVQDFAQLRTR